MRFTLNIELGNDAMQDRMDVAGALERVSHTLAASPLPEDTQGVRDLNGNTVGRWQFVDHPALAAEDYELVGTLIEHFGGYLADHGFTDYGAEDLARLWVRLDALKEKLP